MINFDYLNTMLLLGDQIKPINPVMTYYIKYYAIKKVLNYVNSNYKIPNFQQIDNRITLIRKEIDTLRQQHSTRFSSFDQDIKMIENNTLKLFNRIDDEERKGALNLTSLFIFTAHMFSLLQFYVPSRYDFKEKKLYCQSKALDQYQKLESSGIYVNNEKVQIGVFVDSYLFDPQSVIQPAKYLTPSLSNAQIDLAPPIIKTLKIQPTASAQKIAILQQTAKEKLKDAISELDFKNTLVCKRQLLEQEEEQLIQKQGSIEVLVENPQQSSISFGGQGEVNNDQEPTDKNQQIVYMPMNNKQDPNNNQKKMNLITGNNAQKEQNDNDYNDNKQSQIQQNNQTLGENNQDLQGSDKEENVEKIDENFQNNDQKEEQNQEELQNKNIDQDQLQDLQQVIKENIEKKQDIQENNEEENKNDENQNQNKQDQDDNQEIPQKKEEITQNEIQDNDNQQHQDIQEQLDHNNNLNNQLNNQEQQNTINIQDNQNDQDNKNQQEDPKQQQNQEQDSKQENQDLDQKQENEELNNDKDQQKQDNQKTEESKQSNTQKKTMNLIKQFLSTIPKKRVMVNGLDAYASFYDQPQVLERKKSFDQPQKELGNKKKKQPSRQVVIQDLRDFKENNYKVLTEEQKKERQERQRQEEEARLERERQEQEQKEKDGQFDNNVRYTPRSYQRMIEERKREAMRQALLKKESQLAVLAKKKKKTLKKKEKQKKQSSVASKILSPGVVIIEKPERKVVVRNDLRGRMEIDKDETAKQKAIQFVLKQQKQRQMSEQNRMRQMRQVERRIEENLQKFQVQHQVTKEMLLTEKRKKALQNIERQMKQIKEAKDREQQNAKFLKQLQKNKNLLGHYSIKKFYQPNPLITEIREGDAMRSKSNNEYDNSVIEQPTKQPLLNLPKLNQQSPISGLIQTKKKKAWQIEQELSGKRNPLM